MAVGTHPGVQPNRAQAQCNLTVWAYVCRRLNLGRIRKDIDNPGATWEPCRTLTVSMSHEESSRPEPSSSSSEESLHASARGRNKVATAFQYRTWSPVMAYLPTPVTEWTAPGHPRIPVHTPDQNPILELGNVRRHGTLQHPVHSGNHGIALCTTTVHARMHVRTDRAHFLIRLQIHRAELATPCTRNYTSRVRWEQRRYSAGHRP
jgi:hypothetical protein